MRILSLDWDAAYQRDLALELEAAGHHVELASRAGDALAADAQRPFDLILSEARLPDKSGMQFVRELAAARGGPVPPVVFLTSLDDPEIRDLCLAEGARRCLRKSDGWPTTVAEIHGMIAEIEPPVPGGALEPGAGRPEARVFRGNLETIEILDLIQLLNLGRKSGALVLSGGVTDGRIVFEAGEIVDARNHDQRGSSAFATLLTLKRGSFRFEAGPLEFERTIQQPTSSLLLDALREHDESERRSHAGAPGGEDEEAAFDFEHRAPADSGWLYAGTDGSEEVPAPADPGGGPAAADEPGSAPSSLAAESPVAPPFGGVPSSREAPAPPRGDEQPPAPSTPLILTEPLPPSPEEAGQMPEWPASEPLQLSRPPGGRRTLLLRGSGRALRLHRRRAVAAAAVVVLAVSGYALFTEALNRPAEAVESVDYRRLMLEAAANQARIDSLEQVVHELTASAQSGEVPQADAAQQISQLQSQIQQASASLDEARRAAEAKIEAARRREREESRAPAEASESEPGTPEPTTGPVLRVLADSSASALPTAGAPAEDGVAGQDLTDAGPAPVNATAAPVSVLPVDVAASFGPAPSTVAEDAAAASPATPAAPAADYGLAALRRGPAFVPVDARPMPRSPIRPKYPRALAERKVGGTVTLWTLVGESGRVEDVRVLRSSGQPELDKAALDAIRGATYNPARRDGAAVPAWAQQQVTFKLE